MSLFPSVWRPSSLAVLDACPRRFALRQEGWQPKPDPRFPPKPHAEFGTLWHAAAENYDTLRFLGEDHEAALDDTIESTLADTWTDRGPWAGTVVEQWTCTGLERSASGRRKFLCDAARDWWAGDQRKCPKCGRDTERKTSYVPDHAAKNRSTLLRSVVTYCDNAEGFSVGSFDDGKNPALETELEFDLGPYRIQMHMDRYSRLGDQGFPHERKTTSRQVGRAYWQGYEQSLQVQLYDLGMHAESLTLITDDGQVHIGPQRCDGVVLEALQVQVGGERLSRTIITRGPEQRTETAQYVTRLIHEARVFADLTPLLWTGKLSSCLHAAGGMPCEYLRVCTRAPSNRRHELEQWFEQPKEGEGK